MDCRWKKELITAGLVLLFGMGLASAQSQTDALKAGFENPPEAARPRVWWHWMNGNISREGIKLDLEWMHRVGLGGFQNFDAALSTPQVVDHRLAYMTPEWKDAFKFATTLADQLGMEEAIAGSPGWSESGGPWVPASQGMKKYVWSETFVEGGKPFTGTLAHPPSKTGAFQSLGIGNAFGGAPPQFYADAAVVAFRRAASDVSIESLHPTITSSGVSLDAAMLTDGDLEKTTELPIPAAVGESSWIQYEFAAPATMRSVTYVTKEPDEIAGVVTGIGAPEKNLEASDDGKNFRLVARLSGGSAPEHTISFPAVTARFFRVTFKRMPPPQLPSWAAGFDIDSMRKQMGPPPADYEIAELALHPGARVNRFEEKAAFTPEFDLYGYATPPVAPDDAISNSGVVDLTARMHPDGTLDWTPPAGDWVVLRFGYSLLGITNHPATA